MNTIDTYPIYYVNEPSQMRAACRTQQALRTQLTSNRSTSFKKAFRITMIILFIVIAISFGTLIQAFASTHASTSSVSYSPVAAVEVLNDNELIHVVRGDTLWGIANKYASEKQSVRSYINKIYKLNKLSSVNLQEGQALYLP